jgi:curved DNA-binding protein
MTSDEVKTIYQARAVLGLEAEATAESIRAAFNRAVKTAHPDRGGDPARFRQVLDAYRLLSALVDPSPARERRQRPRTPGPAWEPAQRAQPASGVVRITVAEAFLGADKDVRLPDGRQGRVKLKPGLRSGDVVRFGPGAEDRLTVSVTPQEGLEVRGDDLWMTTPVSAAFLREGGRLEVVTPLGRRALWISRSSAARGLFRTPGEGLPASDTRPRGCLYLRLVQDETLSDSPAKSLLRRFAAAWAA